MKRSVSWHEECLVNMKRSLARAQAELESQGAHVEMLSEQVAFAERQIAEAKRRGLEAFDEDRLLVTRKK